MQKNRTREILLKLRQLGIFTAVGGPFVSVKEDFFDGLCDVKFVGEAETTWPQFLDDFASGAPTEKRYKQSQPTDMSQAPRPRFDLLKADRYASGALQYSRGCPFQCEFCDIIVIFGRRPRVKEPDQLVAELDDMRRVGFHSAFIVDDNFIGDKKKAKALLTKLIPWMEQHNYPLRLTTEASIDLAEDPELMDMMYRANFRSVFIGIETPRLDSLKETKKFQNVRGDSLEAKLARIQKAGLDINAGFIVGFDSDDKGIFEDQFRFIQDNGITLAMVGMLQAIPTTPLYERLRARGTLGRGRPQLQLRPAANDPRRIRARLPRVWSSGYTRPRRSWSASSRSTNRQNFSRACRDLSQGWRRQDRCPRSVMGWSCCGLCSGPWRGRLSTSRWARSI